MNMMCLIVLSMFNRRDIMSMVSIIRPDHPESPDDIGIVREEFKRKEQIQKQ
jgi:hypothetical protein